MQISDINNAGALPALEAMVRFAAARQRILAHNIANIDTPDFRPSDLSPTKFQQQLAQAVRTRRANAAADQPVESGELRLEDTDEVSQAADGSLTVTPGTPSGNILYHDRNNRDPERMMQALAENQLTYRVATDLLRRQMELMRVAVTQRP